jgi:hypothetical protein
MEIQSGKRKIVKRGRKERNKERKKGRKKEETNTKRNTQGKIIDEDQVI